MSKATIVNTGLFSRKYEPAGQTTAVAVQSSLSLDAITLWTTGLTRAIIAVLGAREAEADYIRFYEVVWVALSTSAPIGLVPNQTRMIRPVAYMFSLIKGKHKGTFANGNFTATFRPNNNPSVPPPSVPLMMPESGPDTPNNTALRRIPNQPGSCDTGRALAYERISAAFAEVTGQPMVDYTHYDTTNETDQFARITIENLADSPHGIFFNVYAFPADSGRNRMLAAIRLTDKNSQSPLTVVEWTNSLRPSHMTPANVGSHMALGVNSLSQDVITVVVDVVHYVVWWIGVMDGIILQNKETGTADFPLPSFLVAGNTFDVTYFALAYILYPLYNQFRNNQVHVPISDGPVPTASQFLGNYVETGTVNVPPAKAELTGYKNPAVVVEALRRMSPPIRMNTPQGENVYVPVLAGEWSSIKTVVEEALVSWGNTTTDTVPNLDLIRMRDTLTDIKYSINPPETGAYREMMARAQVDFRKSKPYLGLATLAAYNEADATFTGMMRVAFSEDILVNLRESLRTVLSEKARSETQAMILEMELILKDRVKRKAERAEAAGATAEHRVLAAPTAQTGFAIGTIYFGKPNAKANLALDFPIPTLFTPLEFGGQGNDERVNTLRLFLRAKSMTVSAKLQQPTGLLYSGGLAMARAPTQDDPSDEVSHFFALMSKEGRGGMLGAVKENVDEGTGIAKDLMNTATLLARQGSQLATQIDHEFSTPEGRAARSARKQHRKDTKQQNKEVRQASKAKNKVDIANSKAAAKIRRQNNKGKTK